MMRSVYTCTRPRGGPRDERPEGAEGWEGREDGVVQVRWAEGVEGREGREDGVVQVRWAEGAEGREGRDDGVVQVRWV